jgi:NodT family efflux transporter outer membrane factor (OMF) lipoprotein
MNMKHSRMAFIIAVSTALPLFAGGLSGCAVRPDYARPKTMMGDVFTEAPERLPVTLADWKIAEPENVDTSPWWTVFRDETLNAFMPQLAMANPDADTARANLRAARAAVREATASFFSTISVGGDASRGQTGGHTPENNAYKTQLSASWEFDLFGGIYRGRESMLAASEAAEAELAATLLALRAELAQNYFQLRYYDEQIVLYEEMVAAYEKSLQITRNQHKAGTVTRLDVAQTETQLENARASMVDIELSRRQTEYAIAALLGLPPSLLSIKPAPITAHLPVIEPALPVTLLERRPDIAVAERRMASANEKIGVAKAAYFPVVSLSSSGGYSGDAFRELFMLPNRIWSVGANLAQKIFQGDTLLARTDQAVASWEASVAAYRKTVLSALKEVENQLAAVNLLEREEAIRLEALRSARDTENLVLTQYKGGVVTYLSVVSAQTTALSSARNAATLKGRRYMAGRGAYPLARRRLGPTSYGPPAPAETHK